MQSTALVEAGSATSLTTITKETIVDPLDSLPYVDTELNDEETRARVQAMIQHEARQGKKRLADYLAEVTSRTQAVSFEATPMFQQSLAALETGNPPPPIDFLAKYAPKPPSADEVATDKKWSEVKAWQDLADQYKIATVVEADKTVNLQLMKKYGPPAWLKSLEYADSNTKNLERAVQLVEEESKTINRKRKHDQTNVGAQLQELESTYSDLVSQNHGLAYELFRLERQVKKLKQGN